MGIVPLVVFVVTYFLIKEDYYDIYDQDFANQNEKDKPRVDNNNIVNANVDNVEERRTEEIVIVENNENTENQDNENREMGEVDDLNRIYVESELNINKKYSGGGVHIGKKELYVGNNVLKYSQILEFSILTKNIPSKKVCFLIEFVRGDEEIKSIKLLLNTIDGEIFQELLLGRLIELQDEIERDEECFVTVFCDSVLRKNY